MTANDIHGIEKGWEVKTADGHGAGSVEEATHTYILVKSGLINTAHRYLPSATLEHVRPEKNEIGISLTQAQLEEGDWSEPPREGPRTHDTPLNESEVEEIDPVASARNRDPERPTNI